MKYVRFDKKTVTRYNLVFIYEDKLSNLNQYGLKGRVLEDLKLDITNKLF